MLDRVAVPVQDVFDDLPDGRLPRLGLGVEGFVGQVEEQGDQGGALPVPLRQIALARVALEVAQRVASVRDLAVVHPFVLGVVGQQIVEVHAHRADVLRPCRTVQMGEDLYRTVHLPLESVDQRLDVSGHFRWPP